MRTLTHTLQGETCHIRVPEYRDDIYAWRQWMECSSETLGLDTEGTGLEIFTPNHELRLVQVGDTRTAWVIPSEKYSSDLKAGLDSGHTFVAHNAGFDALSLDIHNILAIDNILPRLVDTKILAHLIDPRAKQEGGTGHGLKALAEKYVDPAVPDTSEGLHAVFRSIGLTKATGWRGIPIDNETYIRYAGLDVLIVTRLLRVLERMIRDAGLLELCRFEHRLLAACVRMERRGMRVDDRYVGELGPKLKAEAEHYAAVARDHGVDNVNSTTQVATALLKSGESLTEKTAAGKPKVDKGVVLPMADLSPRWERLGVREPNMLADAVVRSKRAAKWRTSYAEPLQALQDAQGRVHPNINALQARTARMSVSKPPLQQLPSGDWVIRRAFIADPGYAIVAADYQAVEMRVLAALSGDKTMVGAILAGEDLHGFTALQVFGEGYTGDQRNLCKGVGFGKVYGGGAAGIARQTGAPVESVRRTIEAYDRTYPAVRRYSRRLQAQAEYGRKEVVTPIGRRLPLDRDRLYSATNYVVQSTARDLLAAAIIRIDASDLGDGLLLPVHDELITQAPVADAAEFARELARLMGDAMGEVPIAAEADIYGGSWGHGYGCTTDKLSGACTRASEHPRKWGVTHALAA